MSKQFYFLKKVVQGGLANDTFLTLWDLLESWTSQNNWMAIFFIIFLGIVFEIVLLKICTAFQKKPAPPSEKHNSDTLKKDSCLKIMKVDNWSVHSSSEERVDDFSERTVTSSLTSEGNEGNFGDRAPSPDEPTWESTSESKYRVSHFSESHMTSSDGTSSSVSLFQSEVQEVFLKHRGCPEVEHKTIQFSSKKLFSIMKTKQNKNVMFSSDFNFSRTSRIITESEDLDVAPCPPAHLFLSRDQVRLLEESVRNQIPLKSKATLESKTAHLYSRSQEPLIQNQHFVRMDISAEAQDSSPGQNDIQNQGFSEAQFTSQAPRFANNQEAITSQPDIEARDFALPQDLMRKPLSSRTQDPFQTQDVDRSQHLVQVPHFVETQDSIKDLESDAKHSDEAQYSFWFEDSNKVKNSVPGQNTVLNNAGHLAFTLSPNSVAKVMPQHKSIRTKGQKQIASSKLNQYPAYGSVPLPPTMTRQKNRRKTIHTKSKLSLKVPSQKSNKTPTSRVFQITVCHTSEHSKLRHKCKTKKKELHQRKGISGIALRLIYVFKLVPPSIRKYSRKRLVKSMPGLTGCRHFLLKQNKSLYAEKLNYTESVEKRGTSGSTKNKKQLGRDNKELENISPKIPPQLEESFMVNTYQRKAPCSSLIDTNWKSKESLKEPIIQAKEMDISEFCAPNSEKTFDLHIAKHDTPLEEAISEPLQRLVSSPKMESDRRMKTWEDLKSTEKSHLPLSRGEKLPTSTSDMQRCFPKGNTQKKEDFLEIVLEPADVNLFISLGTKKHTSSEQSASVEIQESPEGVIEKKKKPLIVDVIDDGDLSGSEKLECNTRSSIKNRRDERTSDAFHDVTHTALSEPPLMEMKSGLKTKTDTSGIGLSHSAVKPDELPDDKKPWSAEYIKKRCIFKKPQEHDREEEQQALREAVPQLTPGFRFSLKLKQKPKYVKVEIGQSSSESRTTQDKELEVQPQALSIETVVGTSPLPTVDPFQVEKVKQSTDRPTGSETADPTHPLIVSESLPVGKILTETTGHGVPLGGSPGKPLGGQIAEEKEDLKRILPEVALGSFHRYTIPLSNVKKQKIRKKLPGTQNVLGLKRVIMKVRKSPVHRRRRLRGDFKIMIKQILQDKTVTDMLLNVIDPHVSILPHIRTHSRFNAGNQGCTKLKQEIAEVEREEEFSDTISKGSDSGNTLEAAKLQDEVRGDQEASPEAVLEDGWNLRLDACTEKELKTEKEMQQPIISAEVMMESFYSAIMEPFHVENMKKSRTTPADLRCTADSKMPPPASEKSLIEDPLNQTRESAVPGYGSDTGEMGYSFTETKAELPKDLPAISPETFNCHMPVLSHPKEVKKNRVRFSHLECRVKSKSVHMKASKPSISQICNITGHRKKLKSDFKAKFEKINQANGLLYEFLNTLYSPVHSRLQGETHSFYHAQVNLQVPAGEGRPQYVDFFDKRSAFYDREEKVQDGEEEEQKTLQITAPQPTQYLWMDGCQGKETHLAKPDPALDRLTQEQGIQHQTCFTQTALQTGLQMGPREAKGFQKTTKPEDDGTAPTGLEIPPPEAGNSPENRQGFIFNMYQKKDHDLVKSDEELKQPGSINIRVQPQTHFAQTVLSSASYSALDQMQLRKLESYARFSPPVSGEAKIDEQMFSARECGVPCDVNHWKEPAGGIERKETVTSDFCMTALSISKSKRNFKQYSDMKTLMNPRCGILKAEKPSISHMLNIKGGASPYHRKELRYNLTPKMKEVDPGKKMADNRYSLTTAIPAVNRYSKREREKNTLGEKRFSSKQVKPEASPHEGTVTPDDTEDADLQDEEGKESDQEMLLKIIPQHSQHFIFCSGQRNELDLHKTANKGRGKMLFVIEQDIPQQTPPPGPTQAEGPERSQQTQDVTVWSESSALPLLKSKESPTGLVLSNKMNCPVPSDASHTGGLYDCGKEGKAELREDLQAAVLEFLDASTPDLSESKRQRKTCICRALRSKMSPKCVMLKARKAPISQIFNIPGNGRLKTLPPKTLKSQLVDFVFQIKYSGVLEDLTAEGRKGVAQELPAAIPEVLDLSTLALPVSERNRNNSKLRDKRNKMSPKCVTLKAKKTPVSKTFNITKRSAPSHSRQFECKFKTTKKQGQSVAAVTLNGISSPGLVSLDMIVHNRSKGETDMPWKTGFSHELQLQGQWPDGERARYPNSRASLQLEEEEEDIKTRTVTKYTVDHNIPSPKSRISVLGIPYNERKVGGRISKKHKELPRDLLTISMMFALSESKRQKKALKFPGRKDLMGPKRIIKKAKKPLFSQVLNITEDGHLYCRKEQECHLKSMIQDMQPNRSIADTFLSPTPVSTDNEIDIEIDSTPKTGADQPRVKIHNHTYPELEKAPSDGEAREANLTDTQSRPSSKGKMNVPHEEGEENIPKMLAASVPHYSQHFCSSSHHVKNLGPCQSKSKLNSSEGRRIWNLSCALQNMRQEEHVRETISEHVSRNVMNFIQVQTLKKSLHSQEGIQYMVDLKTSFPKARKSETCFTQCNGLWDGNPTRKWGSPISKKKAWRQSDFIRTVLKPLDFSSLDSSEPKSQSYVLEVVDKKSTTCPKQVPLKAEKLPILQVRNSTRCLTGSRRKKNHKFKYKTRGRQWNEIVRETLLRPTEGAKIPPSQLVIDNLSLNTAARSTLYNNRTLHKNLGGLITEQKAESEEDLAPALLGPLDLFAPVLSDSESQINTVQEKTILNLKCFAMKKKEPFSLQIVKINKQFATKQRTKLRSNLETKMKEIWQGKSVADIFTNVNMPIYFASDTSDTKRQSRLKTEIDRVSRFSPLQSTYMKLPVEGRVILQSLNAAGHAALSISKGQEQETEREKTVLNADLKSTDASASVPLHIRMEQSPSTWGKYGESSEKRNALNKAKLTEKEEYEQQVLSGTPPQYTQPCGFLQKKQQEPCVSGTTQNPAYAYSPKGPKIIKRKANATAASVKKTTHTKQVKSKAEKPPVSLMGNTTEYGTQSKAKETRCNIKKQKPGVQHGKAEAELVLKTVCDSGSVPSQIQGLMEAEREKGKSQRLTHIPPQPKLEKSRNRRQIAFSPSMAKSATSRNIKTVKQYIREQEKNYQIASLDVLPQCRYRFVLSQQLKKEPDHVKSTVDLKREVYPDSPSQKKETNCTRFDISRIRLHTKHKFLITPGVKEGDGDTAQRPFSTPQWRETSKKMDFSFISKGQDMFLPELDASQQKTCKKQELLKQGSISGTHLEPTLYPIMESPYLENTGKVSEEDTCVDRKNISHLLAREGLRETDILRGSNEQTFLCRSGEPLHVKEAVNATGKENVNISIVSSVNPWRKEKPKLTDILLKSNGQKINFSKKWRAKQRNSCNQKKENLLETISSCIVLQLYTEKQKKEVAALSSTVLRLMVENASHKAGQLPCPEGINLHIGGRKEQQENTCKALPTSVSHSLMDILQIKLPRVTKALKEVDSPTYHTSNTEGIGLPIAGREEEQPACMQHICPNLASDPSRDIFQSKMPCKKKASEEVVSTVDYTPSAEGTGLLITGKGDQQEKCMYEVLRKSASHSQAGPCRIDTPVQEVKIGGKNKMNCEYSAPQAKEALKGMDVIVGYIPKNEKRRNLPSTEQSQQHLLIPSENFLEHTSYPPNEPWLPTHVMPPTKEALSEVGNASSRTKELDLISKDHLNAGCGYGLEWTVPSVPPRQMTKQNTSPPLESFGKTVKYQNVSLPKGKKLDGAQVIDSVSNVSSPKLRVRKKVQLHKTCQKNVHKEVYLPGLFSHSLSIHMTLLPENKRQKNDLKQGAKKVIIGPQRTSEKLVFSNIFNITDYGSPGSRPELQWSIREKMVNIKHRKVKPHVVVRNICEFIPSLPYLKLNKKTTDEIISNNVKGIKQPISQKKGDRIKGVNMKGIMDPNVIMKAKISSLSHILIEQELPGLLNITKQESKVQINKGKSGVKLTNLFTSLPSLSHPDLNSRTKAGPDESGTPWNCLPPLKIQTSSNIRKTSFAESIDRDSLSNIIESKQHLPQKKKEDGDNMVYMKNIRGSKCAPFERKKKLLKYTLHRNKPQWDNKEQEKMIQDDNSDIDVVQNKPHVSIPSSPHLEQGPGIKEQAYMRGVSRFCLPPLTLQELSDAVITREEPTDDILSSIKRSKYMPQENENKVEMALEEIRYPKRIALEANQSPVARELQLNIKEKEEKMQADKDEQVGIQRKSCVSISLPPYSEVDIRREGEAVMLRKPRSSFLQPKFQESSDMGNIAYKKPVYGNISNSLKKAKEHIMQEEEGRVKMAKVLTLEKKKSPISQEIQDIKEQKKKIQRIQGEPSVVLTCASIPATSFKLDTRIKEADYRNEVTRYSLPELSHQKSSDVVKNANKESIEGDITSAVQAANEHMPQKGKARGKIANMKYIMYSEGTTSKAKVLPLLHVPNDLGRCSPQIREVQTHRREDLGHVRERSELDEVLIGPCLHHFTLNKVTEGKREQQGIMKPCIPSSWYRESSNAEKLKYTVSPVNDTSSDSRRTKYMTQKEEEKANIFVRDLMHPKCLALKAKKLSLFHILKANKLQVNIKEQVRRGQEGRRDTVVLLSKICPFVTSSVHLKFDTITEEGGPGIIRNHVPSPELQDSLPSGRSAPPKSTGSHRKRGKQHPALKEKDRVQTAAVSSSVRYSGTDFKAKTSSPPHVASVAEYGALSKRKEVRLSAEESVEQGQGRTGDLDGAPAKPPPSPPSPSHHRLDAGTKGGEDLPTVAGFSPSPFQLPESSGARKIRHAHSSQGISSCNIIIKGYTPYKETKVRVKTKDVRDRLYPKIITLEAHTSLTHLLSRNRLPLNVKEQGQEVQDGKGEPEMALRETRASLLSPSYLKRDTSRNEKKDTERITRSCFPPLKIYDPFNPSTKADAKSFDGYLIKDKDRLKTDIEDKVLPREKADTRSCAGYMSEEKARLKTDTEDKVPPISMNPKANELPLSHIHDTKELPWKIKEQKRKVQREESELVTKLKNICTSLLTLPYLKSDTTGEGYMIRITKLPFPQAQSKESSEYAETNDGELSKDVKKLKEHMLHKEKKERERNMDMNSRVDPNNMDLEAKKSPILFTSNLSDLQWKTKGQEEKVQEDKQEPGDATLTETCTSTSSPLPLDENTSIREEGQHLPQNKEEDGVERGNLMSPKHQGKEMQDSKDGPGMVLTKSSISSPSLSAPKLDKGVQVNDEMLALKRSVLTRISNAGQMVCTHSVSGDTMKDVQNEKEERDTVKTVDRRGVAHSKGITLKSKKSPSSYVLHRTELHLNVGGIEQKKQESQGKPPGTVVRKIYVSKPPTKLKLDKGTQVDEGKLGIKKPSLLPRMLSALSDAKKRPDTKGIGGDVIKRKQHMSEKEKKYDVKEVDMRLRTHLKEATISPILHILSAEEFVLNVIKKPGGKVRKGKDEPHMVPTRTFLSIPSAPLYLDSASKIDKDAPGIMGSSHPQQNLQESLDTQKTAVRKSAAGQHEIVKNAEHPEPKEAMQQWTSNFMLSVQQRKEAPRVKSEGDLSQFFSNSQPEDFYFTGFGTIRSGKRLECLFTGPEAHQEKYKPETFTTVLSFPMMDLTKIENLKKEMEIMNNLNHKISPQVLVSVPRKLSKDIYATLSSPISSEGFSTPEQGAYQQETLSKATPGSEDPCKFDKPEEDRRDNEKISEMSPPKVLAPQTKESLEKMNITESNDPQNIEQEIVMKKQVVLRSGSGQKTRVDSSLSLKIPLQNVKQRTPLETGMHKQTTVYPGIQILPAIHMDITEFDAQKGKKEQTLLVPEQEGHSLESLQKSISSRWAFPLQSGDLEEKNKTDTGSARNLEQKILEMKERVLKIDTNIAVHLEEDKIEMHKHTVVNLEKETIKMDTISTVNLNMTSLKAEEPQMKSQVITHTANSCPVKQKHKKEREASGAKQTIQLQKMFQKHVLDSFYAYIPLSPKFGGQKGRLTIADLKRELNTKCLNMETPKHPVLQILGNTGHGTPSNRKKLEYNFNRPKKIALWREGASGIFIRSLSIAMMHPSQTKETVKSETNLERAKRTHLSKFQKKPTDTSETVKTDSCSTVKEGDQNFTNTVPRDSQPFVADKQQMHQLPSIKSEANLSSEMIKNLAPQTKESIVPGDAISRTVKETDLLMIEQEEVPKPIQTPTECPLVSEDPKENCASPPEHRGQSEPVQDTAIQEVEKQKASPGTVSIPPRVKSNELKIVADSPSAESLLPLYEAIKNVFVSQVKNTIKFFPTIPEKVKDDKRDDWKSPPLAGGPDTTSMTIHPKLQPKPILENFTCKEKVKLTNHLESKAPEIKLNSIPEVVKQSFQKFSFYQKLAISRLNSWKLYPRHKNMFFLSLEGIDTIEFKLKLKYQKDSPPVSSMNSLIVNVSRGSEEIITKLKSISVLESGTSSLTSARERTLPHILQNYSVGGKNKLLIHFSVKTLEIQMKAFPRIVRESYTMASAQDGRKLLSKCIHSGVKAPKRKNRVFLLFEEKSLHQIDLDLQYKYLRFLLGSSVESMFPQPNAFPKHVLKLQTVAICKKVDDRGESGGLSINTEPLEEHLSLKEESFHENSSLVRNFLEPTQVCASDPNQHNIVQKDTVALSKLQSPVTPKKDKQCHVWFQETNTCESVDLKTQEKAQELVDSHSIQNSEDFPDSQTNTESSDNVEECSEVHESEECMFLDANLYLSQKSQNILFELQKDMPLENLCKKKKIETNLKPLYREDSDSHHIRGCQKHSLVVTPSSYESHKSRKHRSSSKMRPPDSWYHSSSNTIEVSSISSSIPFSEEQLSQTTRSGKSYSLVPLTESNIKLHLAKSQGKPHRHLESKERKKAKSDLFRKNNTVECDDSYTQSKEKHTRKKKVKDYESERSDYFPSKHKSASKPHQEDINFHSERKQNQPFFYACIPADSLEIMPQTIRWTIPLNTLRKKNFRVPLVAKISSSYNIWSSSKKLLGSLLESFSRVHQK
ncbi:leucine-rich repeat transmembrane protein CCDC168 [Hippopotamus amphibius kiboko]|uniref:leucine-rich repeat transmembrane protein CCDC168 n=1 Tax=Hippopotamus amphibius kiboko TaxID=575201 RepID=UPI0025953569|nr:leucine-rich repeat transmembrane protein CCDC168 [Hippopotamus amphibius kiboko]